MTTVPRRQDRPKRTLIWLVAFFAVALAVSWLQRRGPNNIAGPQTVPSSGIASPPTTDAQGATAAPRTDALQPQTDQQPSDVTDRGVEQRGPAYSGTGAVRDLSRDEAMGGHTLARHVGRTDDDLRARLRRERDISAASTYTDRATAEHVVGEALLRNQRLIESWIAGDNRANKTLHYRARAAIGRSVRRGDDRAVTCTEATIVLRARGDDFYVLTSYPEASR